MKESLVALTVLAVAGAASAQSSVTVFGVVDAAVSGYSNKSKNVGFPTLANPFDSVKVSRTALSNSGYNTSRLGFRGTEDLGGGLTASFWLEAPITNDDGQTGISTFARRSTVSLSGAFGEVRLGRDYTPMYWNDTVFDPFGANGVGASLVFTANGAFNTFNGAAAPAVVGVPSVVGSNYARASNSIGYFLPSNLGGFYGQVMYAFHEKDKFDPATVTPTALNNSRTGRYIGGRFGYANGPLDVALAYGNSTIGDNFFAGTTTSVKTVNLGGSYDFGVVKLFGEYSKASKEVDYEVTPLAPVVDTDLKGYVFGVTVPVGPGLIRVAYSQVKYDFNLPFSLADDPKADKVAIGYVHNLSKRTALYATVARVNNKNGSALTVGGPAFISNATFAPKTSTGYDVGIRHAF
ncbi:porin [Variovorax sp. 2RAF20]